MDSKKTAASFLIACVHHCFHDVVYYGVYSYGFVAIVDMLQLLSLVGLVVIRGLRALVLVQACCIYST